MTQPRRFSIEHYEQLLVMLHNARDTLNEATTERANAILEELDTYTREHPLKAEDFLAIKRLLTHPKRGVRSTVSIELLENGYIEAWPTLIEAAKPTRRQPIRTQEDGREDSASYFTRLYLMFYQTKYDQLGLKPSFDEAQDQWIAEGLMKDRLPKLALPSAPTPTTKP